MATYGTERTTGMETATTGQQTGTYATEQQQTGMGMTTGQYGRVILTLKSAHNLRDKAWIGKADPYCEIRVADATVSTHHVPGAGEHATWDESFAFNNVSPDDMMEFHVYDHNKIRKDAHMGEGSISLRQVFQSGQQDIRVPLTARGGTKDAGEVWLTLRSESGAGGMGKGEMGYGGVGMGKAGYEGEQRGYEGEQRRYEGEQRGYEGEQRGMETTTTGMTTATRGTMKETGEGLETAQGAVCGQEYFTKVEDRPVVHEQVSYYKEHRPVEKEFVVETHPTGVVREATEGRKVEHLGTQERIVAEAKPKEPCD